MVYVVMLVLGLGLAAWNAWQRLGRTSDARGWASSTQGAWSHRKVLVLWPAISIALVCGSGFGLAERGAMVAGMLSVGFALAMLVFFAYLFLPLPVPRFVQPSWYRRRARADRVH